MKFLILGCNGMAGHMISIYLKEKGYDVVGFARTKSRFVKTIIGDAMDMDLVKDSVGVNKFDCVINCIGILNQYAERNKSNAVCLNSYLPHYLAEITEKTNTQVIHMSTDCVFSGERGGYSEDDLKDGTSFYDRTKALGELDDDKNMTLRNSVVGPDINPDGIGLLNWFMQQKGQIVGYTKAIWTGVTTLQLAKNMEKVAMERINGLYNAVPDESISKYELLMLFNKYLRVNQIKIFPSDQLIIDKSLKRRREGFDLKIPDYETMVIELGNWLKKHSDLYPQYEVYF